MTTKREIQEMVERLAALMNQPLVLEVANPGDGTRYRLSEQDGPGLRHFGRTGSRTYSAREIVIALNGLLDGAERLLPGDVFAARMRAYHDARRG